MVGRLDLVLNRVRQGHLHDIGRKAGGLRGPIAECRPESVHGQPRAHAAQQFQHRHVAEMGLAVTPEDDFRSFHAGEPSRWKARRRASRSLAR